MINNDKQWTPMENHDMEMSIVIVCNRHDDDDDEGLCC